MRSTCSRSPISWCTARCGLSVATAGPTTSTTAASITRLAAGKRQHPRARHRGLFEHRRPGVEGDAARRLGEVRRRGQDDAAQGPGDDGHRLRQRLRRPKSPWAPTTSRRWWRCARPRRTRAVDDPGLLPVHRPRYRPAPWHEAGGSPVASGYWPLFRFDPTMRGRAFSSPSGVSRPAVKTLRLRGFACRLAGIAPGQRRARFLNNFRTQ